MLTRTGKERGPRRSCRRANGRSSTGSAGAAARSPSTRPTARASPRRFSTFKSSVESENRNRFFRRNLGYFAIGVHPDGRRAGGRAHLRRPQRGGDRRPVRASASSASSSASSSFPIVRDHLRRPRRQVDRRRRAQHRRPGHHLRRIHRPSSVSALPVAAGRFRPVDRRRHSQTTLSRSCWSAASRLMNGLFFYLLRAPTAAGRESDGRDRGAGTLHPHRRDRPAQRSPARPISTPTQFERLLPYAIALNAEKPWSRGVRRRPSPALIRARTWRPPTRPAWHGGLGWSGDDFGSSLSSAVSAAQGSFASSVPAPSSSSSGFSGGGGGGGSGGGGGGGGGGGW